MFSGLYLGFASPKLIAIFEKLHIGLLKKNADAGFFNGLASNSLITQSSYSSENSNFSFNLFSILIILINNLHLLEWNVQL